jgi:hypothetical protein
MTARDAQRGRVYAWEDATVAPRDPGKVAFAAAQGMIDAIWAEQGLRYPPRAEKLPPQARRCLGDATRLRIRLPPVFSSWLLLHELAHAMSSTHDGESDGHGAVFMGLYVKLLAQYLRLPRTELLASLRAAGVTVDAEAKPIFVDARSAVGPASI